MKKINKVMLVLIGFIISMLFNTSASAATLVKEPTGYYWHKTVSGNVHEWTDSFNYYYVDGEDGYCLDIGSHEGASLSLGDLSTSGIPYNVRERVLLIAFYGYNYSGHQTLKYRAATQALIWETIEAGTKIGFFTERFGSGEELDISKERQEIEKLISNYYKTPTFASQNYSALVGQPITLNDTNDVLSNYDVFVSNATYSISDNSLTITPTVDTTVTLKRKTPYMSNYKIFVSEIYQNQVVPGNINDDTISFDIHTYYGKVDITKYDIETRTKQGSARLDGANYGIYEKNGDNLVTTLTTDENGNASSDFILSFGEYYIKEIKPPKGYLENNQKYYFEIKDSYPIHLDVFDEVIKGKIKINKVNAETGVCSLEEEVKFQGAKYQIINSNNQVVDTVIIGDNCYGISKELPYDNYLILETEAPVGYNKDSARRFKNIQYPTLYEVTSKEKIVKGKIEITKLDSFTNSCSSLGEATLKDAKYQVLDSEGNVVDIITIGANCVGISKELNYGYYKVKEIEAPKGYKLDNNIYEVLVNITNPTVINQNVIKLTIKEDIIMGKIQLEKFDLDTNSCISMGQASLAGATYQILDYNNNVVDTLVIDDSCTSTSIILPYGSYTIKEIRAPMGYKLDPNIYNAKIVNNSVIKITLNDEIIKNNISLLKQYDDGTNFLKAEENIIFEIYDLNNTKYGEVSTDKNGYAIITLPYGKWIFHQVNTINGYEKTDDFHIIVDENSDENQYYNVLNKKLEAYLRVEKIDFETKQIISIPNTSFKILDVDNNQYITQYVGGKYLDTFYTDESGVMQTYLKLGIGNYKLEEIDSPNGYLLDEDGLYFSICDDSNYIDTKEGQALIIDFANKPIKGKLKIFKKGESFLIDNGLYYYDWKDLEGVKFKIYTAEDILSSDKKYLYYKKNSLVDTIVTDEFGNIESKELPLGKYYFKESQTSDGYILDSEKYYFELTALDNQTPIVYVVYENFNYLKKGKLEITKVDSLTGKGISNTVLQLFTEDNELIFTGTTDEKGKLIIDNLVLGKYYIKELKPNQGYVLSDEKIYLELNRSKQNLKMKISNNPVTGTLKFLKLDFVNNAPLAETEIELYNTNNQKIFDGVTDETGEIIVLNLPYGKYYVLEKTPPKGYLLNKNRMSFEVLEDNDIIEVIMFNERAKTNIKIKKVDDNNNLLSDVIIAIYDEKDNLVYEGVTNEEGVIETSLEYGKYYYKEIQTIDGFILDEEKVFFEVLNDDNLEFTLVNHFQYIDVPNTEKNEKIIYNFMPFIFILFGLGSMLNAKQRL